ncbi:MAG TPA: hypothetical protein VFC99_06140 [Acidimicrobiia bacterium]|nr:hypothetical protein [Acidimicrobiia bacterium]
MFGNLHRGAKLAALIATGVVSLGGVAAATGSLPSPVQGAAHDALGAAGIRVPDGDGAGTVSADDTTVTTTDPAGDPTTTTSTPDGTEPSAPVSDDTAKGPDPNGPAKFGLCTAYAAGKGGERGKKHSSTAFEALAAAADADGETVAQFCADATPGGKPASTTTPTTAAPIVDTTEPTEPTTEPATTAPAANAQSSHSGRPATASSGGGSGRGRSHKG